MQSEVPWALRLSPALLQFSRLVESPYGRLDIVGDLDLIDRRRRPDVAFTGLDVVAGPLELAVPENLASTDIYRAQADRGRGVDTPAVDD